MESFDVIVIGAGPAGGSAAWHAALKKLSVLVLEEHPAVGVPVHCGECLSDIAAAKLPAPLPESVISKHVDGVRIIFPNKKISTLYEKGFVLEKHLWEQWIMGEAVKEGAVLKTNARVTGLERNEKTWAVSVNNNQEQFEGKILIDASGPAALSSRLLQFNERPKMVTGFQYEMEDIPQEAFLDFYLWPRLAPEGYLWMIPKSRGRANVGLVTTDTGKAKIYTDQFIKEMGWEDRKINKPFGGLIPESGPVKRTFAESLMLVGDAAGFTSPMFEGGSHLGIMSGKYAAQVAAEAIAQNNFSNETFSHYKALWASAFPKYNKLIEGKNAFYHFTEKELNDFAGLLPENLSAMTGMQKLGIGARILLQYRHLLGKHVLAAFNAFGYSQAEFYGW